MTAPAPWTQDSAAGSAEAQSTTSLTDASFERADCCGARALFRVVLASTSKGSRGRELLLCGHHLRRQHAALVAAHAAVFDAVGAVEERP